MYQLAGGDSIPSAKTAAFWKECGGFVVFRNYDLS